MYHKYSNIPILNLAIVNKIRASDDNAVKYSAMALTNSHKSIASQVTAIIELQHTHCYLDPMQIHAVY